MKNIDKVWAAVFLAFFILALCVASGAWAAAQEMFNGLQGVK